MKRFLRIFALITACVMLCLSFTSCDTIDEMREAHGTWNEDGSISYGGETYMLLPECEELYPPLDDGYIVTVTEKDVPILLADMFGMCFDKSLDGAFLISDDVKYCRSDKYDEIAGKIEAGDALDGYCYSYYALDNSFNYTENIYFFSENEVNAVAATLVGKEPIEMPDGASMSPEYTVEVSRCSEDLLFRSYAFDICVIEDSYYIAVYDTSDGSIEYYKVADEYKATFSAIMATYIQNW